MIELPDFDRPFDYENGFYTTCGVDRVGKLLAHWELARRAFALDGALVECGVFKGASFLRWAMFRELLGQGQRELVGFDTFGEFPDADLPEDEPQRARFVAEAGESSISTDQLLEILDRKGAGGGVHLVAGRVEETVPSFVAQRPDLGISLLHLDVDLYGPSRTVLEHLYPRVVPGGILLLDNYNCFPGETRAVDEYFDGREPEFLSFSHHEGLRYIVKG